MAGREILFGDPGDRFVDGEDTPAVFRPSDLTFYFRHTLSQGVADSPYTWIGATTDSLPISISHQPERGMPDEDQPDPQDTDQASRFEGWPPWDDGEGPMWAWWLTAAVTLPLAILLLDFLRWGGHFLSNYGDSSAPPVRWPHDEDYTWAGAVTFLLVSIAFLYGKRTQRRWSEEGWSPAVFGLFFSTALLALGVLTSAAVTLALRFGV